MPLFPKFKTSLGNYLMTLLSVMRIAHENGENWYVCDKTFKSFFSDSDCYRKKPTKCSEIVSERAIVLKNSEFDENTMEFHSRYNNDLVFVYQLKPFMYLPKNVKLWYQKAFQSLLVREILQYEISKYDPQVGMHIRTFKATFNPGANNELSHKLHKVFSRYLVEFEEILQKLESCFLCCDDTQVIEYLKEKCPNTKITTYTRNECLSNMENDFVEFMILSKCRKLYGTYFSTFSEMCYLISDKVEEYTSIPVNYEPVRRDILAILE